MGEGWKWVRLGEVATFAKGKGYSKSSLTTTGTPILLYGQLYTNYQPVIQSVATVAHLHTGSIVSTGREVVVPASGETAEDIARASAIVSAGIIIGSDLNIITPYNDVDSRYLALIISFSPVARSLSAKAQGKTVVHLHTNDLINLSIPLPPLDEQRRIAGILGSVDAAVDSAEARVEKLRQMRAAAREKLLTPPSAE